MNLLLMDEVADTLRVPKRRAYELARLGLLPVVRVGRQVRVAEPALDAWIEAGGQALDGGWRRQPPPIGELAK